MIGIILLFFLYQFGANSDGIYRAIDELEESEKLPERETSKVETYIRFSN
jgi:hypothetical protein